MQKAGSNWRWGGNKMTKLFLIVLLKTPKDVVPVLPKYCEMLLFSLKRSLPALCKNHSGWRQWYMRRNRSADTSIAFKFVRSLSAFYSHLGNDGHLHSQPLQDTAALAGRKCRCEAGVTSFSSLPSESTWNTSALVASISWKEFVIPSLLHSQHDMPWVSPSNNVFKQY